MDTRLKKFKYTGTSKERRGEGGTTGPIYELVLLCQTFILFLCTFVFLCSCVFGFHIWCSPLCIHNMANINNTRGYDGCPANFISWNVKSLNHPVKLKKVLSHLKQLSADIAFLQETHIRACDSSRLVRGWAGQVYQSNFCSKARGVAIMISKKVQFTASHVQSDSAG